MREIPTQNLVRSLKVFSFRVLVEVEIPHSNPGPFAPGVPGRVGGRRGRPARAAPALPCNLFRTMSGIPPPNLVKNLRGFSFRFLVEVEIPHSNSGPFTPGATGRGGGRRGRRRRCPVIFSDPCKEFRPQTLLETLKVFHSVLWLTLKFRTPTFAPVRRVAGER